MWPLTSASFGAAQVFLRESEKQANAELVLHGSGHQLTTV